MDTPGSQRRLAAIVLADVAGYSRLMGKDEDGTLAALRSHRTDLIEPNIARHGGRTVKTMGDGFLWEFPSVVEAVQCAVDIQEGMLERNASVAELDRIAFRIGINLGDVIVEGEDIFGDGVNVAARLEGLSETGGICVSDIVQQSITGKLNLQFDDLGEKAVKNIDRPVRVWRWRSQRVQDENVVLPREDQDIRFCEAPDGVQIAYATVGRGPPLVKAPNWMHHLEYDWQSPIWRHLLQELSRDHTLVRFDQRTNGLSDWEVEDISLDAFVRDLETVVDVLGLDRFPLVGISQGCAYSIAYAVKHPERVSRLVLYGGFARGVLVGASDAVTEQVAAMSTLVGHGWGQDNPAWRQVFTTRFMPGATPEQITSFNELQRISISPENAVRVLDVINHINVLDQLSEIKAPTLVLHCRGDAIIPFKEGRRMAAGIPGARFVPLEGDNHIMLEGDPAWPRFLSEIRGFLSQE